MTFEITEHIVEEVVYHISYYGVPVTPNKKFTTHYDVVRVGDRKVVKSFIDLLEALYYKNELEKLSGPHSDT